MAKTTCGYCNEPIRVTRWAMKSELGLVHAPCYVKMTNPPAILEEREGFFE